jgi:hypothetical protein
MTDDDSLCPDCSLRGGDRVCKYCTKLNNPRNEIPRPEEFDITEDGGEVDGEKQTKAGQI